MYERLRRLIGLGAAAFFADAVRMLQGPAPASFDPGSVGEDRPGDATDQLETASHLIGHCMREIDGAVLELLWSGIPRPPSTQKTGRHAKAPSGQRNDGHVTKVKAILTDFGIALDSPVAQYWIEVATPNSEEALHRRAHRNDQGSPRPVDAGLQNAWQSLVKLLDELLDRFEGRYTASVYDRLDRLATTANPSAADVAELKTKLPHTDAAHRYFFGKVTSPGWLPKLKDAGLFANPPEPIQEEDGIRLPPWPQADYLARVAIAEPNAVRGIIANVHTTNTTVQWQLMEIVRALPVSEAVKLVPKVHSWVPGLRRFEFVDPLLQFIALLSDGGHGDEAVGLLAELYGLEDEAE